MPEKKFEPDLVKERVITAKLTACVQVLEKMIPGNTSRLYVDATIEGLEIAKTLVTPDDFNQAIDQLGLEANNLKKIQNSEEAYMMFRKRETISEVEECLRFFWDGMYNLYSVNALYSIQRVLDYPVWSAHWRFQEFLKPNMSMPAFLEHFYQGLNIGNRVQVSNRWSGGGKNPQDGLSGEVVGFAVGLQAQFNSDYLIVYFKDSDDWIQNAWLYTLNPIHPNPDIEFAGF